jgi:hypothetical protein
MSKERLTSEEKQQRISEIINKHLVDLYLHGLRYGYETNTPLIAQIMKEIFDVTEAFAAQEVEAAIAERMPTEEDKVKCISCKMDFPIMETYFNWDTGARRCWTCQVAYLENVIKQIEKRMPTDTMKNIWQQYQIYWQKQHYHNEKKLGFLRWFRSRMEEKPEEEYIDKSISIDEYMEKNPKLDPHEQ